MSSAEAIRVQITECEAELNHARAERARAFSEAQEAQERQALRRKLDHIKEELQMTNANRNFWVGRRHNIDRDLDGDFLPDSRSHSVAADPKEGRCKQQVMDCDAAVAKGEIEWSIKGFSWLRTTLSQNDEDFALSTAIDVGGHSFCLCYHPERGELSRFDKPPQRGSLAILHLEHPSYKSVAFRYWIWIKSKDRGFVQWGNSSICLPNGEDAYETVFGPDVCSPPDIPRGIWNMSHERLEKSEWVVNDVMTIKVKVEVRPYTDYITEETLTDAIAVSPSSLGDEFLALLDTGASSDVTFTVQGESIQAHSQILSARSNVFRRQFACGMRESISKEVNVEDCEAAVFKAFLRQLYSDSFSPLEEFLKRSTEEPPNSDVSSGSTGAVTAPANKTKISALQQLMLVSHKYELARMQQWCEQQLLQYISVENVCSVLCQAHLHDAKKLQEKCLAFIKAHMTEVVKTDAFGSLSAQWPQVCLKIMLHNAAVPEGAAATAAEKHDNARKRKRDD